LVQKIQNNFAIAINSLPGQGYSIATPIDLLCEKTIRTYLNDRPQPVPIAGINIFATTTSTNDVAVASANKGVDNLSVWLSEHQSAGRGRRGKVWQSPMLGNIYCSILWRIRGGLQSIEGLSLVVGIAIAETLASQGIVDVKLKWPNDIWLHQRKLGGVLIEVSGEPTGDCYAVIGFGININSSLSMESLIDQPVCSVSQVLSRINRNLLIAQLLANLYECLKEHQTMGFAAFQDRWAKYDALLGMRITLSELSGLRSMECVGVSSRGALICRSGDHLEEIYSGEISVRVD
jgi:BirA family biotin operon repressor/biotin-[acetyl-CoA-carboxylase] ligase